MNSWIVLVALCAMEVGSSFSLAPALPCRHPTPMGKTHLFQSSIAVQEEHYSQGRREPDVKKSRIQVCKPDSKRNVYEPASRRNTVTTRQGAPSDVGMDAEEQLAILRSKTLKELKLACSRRNIQYGKFSESEEYVQAIMEDMEKAWAFSVTGLLQPGGVTEVTSEQLDQEMTRKDTLILVDVFATWCGPCRVILPQLQVAAQKMVDDKVRVVKIDAEKHSDWVGRYEVEGLPTMLLIKEGSVVDRLEGAYVTNEIVDFVQQHN